MEEYSIDFVNNLYTEYSPGVAKITIDDRILSLNLSDLCNKISLCNIIDNSAARNSIKKGRLYKEKENEFVMFKADTHEEFCSRSMLQAHFARVSTHEGSYCGSLLHVMVHTREQTKETWCGIADIPNLIG